MPRGLPLVLNSIGNSDTINGFAPEDEANADRFIPKSNRRGFDSQG